MARRARPSPLSTSDSFDGQAWLYDTISWPLSAPLFRAARPVLESRIKAEARILDLACGPGREVVGLSRLAPRGEVVGIDRAPAMVERARRRIRRHRRSRAYIECGDAAALPAAWSSRFDLVFCALSHHHFQRPVAVAREVRRVLRPGGCYAIVDAIGPLLVRRLTPLSRRVDPGFQRLRTIEEFRVLLSGVGFTRVDLEPLSPGFGVVLAAAPVAAH